jgi:hypothetical protein
MYNVKCMWGALVITDKTCKKLPHCRKPMN